MLLTINLNAQDLSQYGWKKGVTINGGLNFNTISYAAKGQEGRRDPFNWFASGNFNMNLFGYSMPFSFSYSNVSRSYTQPFNRIQFRPSYKWIKAYWGNTSMSFSPLTLAGHMFNGNGIELNKGKWNFAAMYGKLKETVAFDPLARNYSTTSFKRKGMGFKGGYRFKNGDEINIIFFTAKDVVNSLTFVPVEAKLVPKKNYVASLGGKKLLFKKFNIQLEYALSSIITDQTAATNNFATKSNNFLKFLLPNKPNAKIYDAIKSSIGYNGKKYGLQFQYERVTPEYETLGAYYFNTDMENYTIVPNFNLFKGKMTLNGNVGVQKNNLDKTKNSTTKRFVGNMNLSFNPNDKWGYSATYSNFSSYTNLRPQNDPFFQNALDSLNFYQVSNTLNANINHQFGTKEVGKTISFNANFQRANDQQPGTQSGIQVSDFITGNIAYTHNILKKGLNISSAINYSVNTALNNKTIYFGPNLNVGMPLFKKLINASSGFSYNKNIVNGVNQNAIINARFSFNYSPKDKKQKDAKPAQKTAKIIKKEEAILDSVSNTNTKINSKDKKNKPKATLKEVVKVQNPLKGKNNLSLNINYMNKLAVINRGALSELTVTFNWSYSF